MNHSQHNTLVNFIWSIADDVLRDVYTRGKYRDIILPFTVLRRLDAILEPTKDKVIEMHEQLNKMKIENQSPQLRKVSGYVFYNTSNFTFKKLLNDPSNIRQNLENYLDGFSSDVQDIISKFKLRNQLTTMEEGNITFALIEKYCVSHINLSPLPVKDKEGKVLLEGLSNLGMGYVFEELIRKFNEENNEEAGEHFTPREIIKLMTHLIFEPIKTKIKEGTYLIYDPACGSGGMLTEAENFAMEINPKAKFHLYGQEVNPETFAICKADMLIKGEDPEKIAFGSTLSNDGFPQLQFDFMLSNPPYGKTWKIDQEAIFDKKGKEIFDTRFKIGVPRVNDGQLLFLMNMLHKMKKDSELGSRVASVHNGSSIFTGDAGSGESEIRKHIIENDWLEAIIALPMSMFYNTEINTFIWVITNKKPSNRKGKVQLINAVDLYHQMVRSMGKKSFEFLPNHIEQITKSYIDFKESDISKIIPNENFSHYQITVDRPLRLQVHFEQKLVKEFCGNNASSHLENEINIVAKHFGVKPLLDYNKFTNDFEALQKEKNMKLSVKDKKLITDFFSKKDENAMPVIKSKTGKAIEYFPDSDLRMIEKIPYGIDIETYFEEEVLPYVSDAWFDKSKVIKGYQIHFSRYFTEKTSLRKPFEIEKEFIELEEKRLSYLGEIFISDPAFVKTIGQLSEKLVQYKAELINAAVRGEILNKDIPFKKSKNPWFDVIPEHWEEIRAKWIFKNHSVKDCINEPLLSVTQGKGAIPRDEYENRVVMPLGELMGFKLVEPGDFVISLRSFQGGIEFSHHRGIISPAYTVLKNRMEIHKPYFRHLLKCDSFIQSLNTAITGIREGKNINYDDFADIVLPMPPMEEQIAIAKLLDDKLPNIELLLDIQQKQIVLFKEQKKIIIDEAVTGKIDIKSATKEITGV